MRKELKEQTEFVKLLNRNGHNAYKVYASKAGVPDIESIYGMTIYKFEQKTKEGVLSPQQKKFFKGYELCYVVKKIKSVFYYYGPREIPLQSMETRIKYGGSHEAFTA